jgi:DNA (cytosine-5)-methyltransferase 1
LEVFWGQDHPATEDDRMNMVNWPGGPRVIRTKLQRLAEGQPPRVLDLFAGCGGISLGFQREGFRIDAAVELEPLPAATHALNIHRDLPVEERAVHAVPRDITKTEPGQLVEDFGLGSPDEAFDVIVGGPPCQAYARIGRAKLREVALHPEAFKVDPRANLWLRYLAYVKELRPLALLMENVPDILNFGGHNVVEEFIEALAEIGYVGRYTLINAARHGVPQMRDRVFLIAYHESLGVEVQFPEPTNRIELPRGYAGTRSVALKFTGGDLLTRASAFEPEDEGKNAPDREIWAKEAIGDLPPITSHLRGELRRGARRFTEFVGYDDSVEPSAYAIQMREWPKLPSSIGVADHVIRYLPRDPMIFRHMKQGDEYPAAHRVALNLLEQEVARLRQGGARIGDVRRADLERKMVPPYDPGKFPNRWWKLNEHFPSRTLTAHIGKDTYSHIHYSDEQARTISVREAARLQSFPDSFTFCGTMNPAFKMIGNSVPPVLASRLATKMGEALEKAAAHLKEPVEAEW